MIHMPKKLFVCINLIIILTAWAYGIQIASLKPDSNGGLSAIFFNSGEFRKVEDFSVGTNTSKAKDDYLNNSQGIEYFCNGYHPY